MNAANWNQLERQIAAAVNLARRPVAVAFLDAPPAGVQKFEGSQPSGCSFWRLAASGRVFYTVPENHFNCAVGAYTHNIALSPERQNETEQTLKMMFDLGYVKPEEVPQIPRLAKAPKAILYGPLGDAPVAPDVVLFACKPAGAMLLNEAAARAGVASGAPALGRPTCMALPASLQHGAILSLGCMGNRVYTGLGEDELYLVVRGSDLARLADALGVITSANSALNDYAKGRRQQLATVQPSRHSSQLAKSVEMPCFPAFPKRLQAKKTMQEGRNTRIFCGFSTAAARKPAFFLAFSAVWACVPVTAWL